MEPLVPPKHRYQASNSQAATACERVQLGFAAARARRWARSWIMRTVLSRMPSDRTSLHGGRPARMRSVCRLRGVMQEPNGYGALLLPAEHVDDDDEDDDDDNGDVG